jgi:hypothetical protein
MPKMRAIVAPDAVLLHQFQIDLVHEAVVCTGGWRSPQVLRRQAPQLVVRAGTADRTPRGDRRSTRAAGA